MSDPLFGALFAVLAAMSWALGTIFVRLGTQRLAVTTGTLVSLLSGFVVILAVTAAMHPGELVGVPRATVLWIALLAMVQFPIGRFLTYQGIRLAGVAPATSIAGSSPLVAAILAAIFLHEPITVLIVAGIVAVVVGLALVMGDSWAVGARREAPADARPAIDRSARSRATIAMGLLSALGGAIGYGASHALARHVTASTPAPVTATYALFFGVLAMLALSLRRLPADLRAGRGALARMAAAGVCSSFGVFFMYTALARAPVVLVSPLVALYPLMAMGLTHAFLQRLDRITVRMVIGGALAALGVALVVVGRPG